MRQIGTLLLLMLAAVACSGSSPGGSAAHATRPLSRRSSSPATQPVRGHVTACRAGSLRLRGGRQGAGPGTARVDLDVTNVGRHPCRLAGVPPIVVLATASGDQLPIGYKRAPNAELHDVTVGTQQEAGMAFAWLSWCAEPPGPLEASMVLPHGHGVVTGPIDAPSNDSLVPTCTKQPSTIELLDAYS